MGRDGTLRKWVIAAARPLPLKARSRRPTASWFGEAELHCDLHP